MCTKQKLYEQLPLEERGLLETSSRTLSSGQIDLATDCLRVLANRHDISILLVYYL